MIGIVKRTSTAAHSTVLRRLPVGIAVAGMLSILVAGNEANAQYFRGFRGRGAVIVGPPILPAPYYQGGWATAPVVVGPPSRVRVQTPFFSLNIGPGSIVPPPYAGYVDRYESYRPRYDSRYDPGYRSPYERGYSEPRSSVPDYRSPPPSQYPPVGPGANPSYGQYRPGSRGGVPDLTSPVQFSLPALRDAAETLYRALAERPDDGDVWLKYLQPERIIAAVDSGQLSPSINELHTRFLGVTMNPDLVVMTRIDGFQRTLDLLGTWIELDRNAPAEADNQPAEADNQPAEKNGLSLPVPPPPEPTEEELPAPNGQIDL
ncbi:hypothetical protein Enr13x_46860 [Stieleria neptunia]|uniref:Uncharacterized protein n=1 Tax=Stieleria neptunia TaxID=2527979 RepID=A0A518HVD6_9BACT|nr:hypothetical protein [Stieleria neptunia]QDV44815.1 hypothetical protein Enr13x_46860 [Stieleria neptunia]